MTISLPDDIAARVRRLPRQQQEQALAYVRTLESVNRPQALAEFAATIASSDLGEMSAAIEAGCERVVAADW
jgi:hypothetical protein